MIAEFMWECYCQCFNLAATYTFYTYLRPMLAGPLRFGTGAITVLLFIYGLMSLFSN